MPTVAGARAALLAAGAAHRRRHVSLALIYRVAPREIGDARHGKLVTMARLLPPLPELEPPVGPDAPDPLDPTRFIARVVRERSRLLAPVIWLVVVFYLAAAPRLGIHMSAAVLEFAIPVLIILTILAVVSWLRWIPERWTHAASAAVLWAPIAITIGTMYFGDNNVLVVLLVVEIASTGILLATSWTVATLVATNLLALPLQLSSGGPLAPLFASTIVTASLFALLIHVIMRRALVEAELHRLAEAASAQQLARKLDELERSQQERAQLLEQLIHSQRMEAVGTLAAGVAHDMNNVLASISSGADLALDRVTDPSARADIEQLVVQASRGASLTRGLLAFSRRGQYIKHAIRISDVLDEVIPLLGRTLPKTIEVRHELADGDVRVEGDLVHLGQVLINLGLNAADAMSGAGVLVIVSDVVELGGHPQLPAGRYARWRVTDTGCGMDAATSLRVFEPFFTTKPLGRGTGLGLSTVWGIVRAHDGEITVASELGKGTTFTIHLPLTDAPEASSARTSKGHPISNATVMVVDDEPAVRETTRRLLVRMGLVVLTATNGHEGLQVFAEHQGAISLVILDIGMPVMGGAECFRRLRLRRRGRDRGAGRGGRDDPREAVLVGGPPPPCVPAARPQRAIARRPLTRHRAGATGCRWRQGARTEPPGARWIIIYQPGPACSCTHIHRRAKLAIRCSPSARIPTPPSSR